MWSEQVQGEAIVGKLWPRGAALAERLWSDPATGTLLYLKDSLQIICTVISLSSFNLVVWTN